MAFLTICFHYLQYHLTLSLVLIQYFTPYFSTHSYTLFYTLLPFSLILMDYFTIALLFHSFLSTIISTSFFHRSLYILITTIYISLSLPLILPTQLSTVSPSNLSPTISSSPLILNLFQPTLYHSKLPPRMSAYTASLSLSPILLTILIYLYALNCS